MILYLRLFYEFFKTGLFTIGGGMATVPFLYKMSTATGWFSHNDVANMIAVSESTPGPIGVNMATYIGFVTGMEQYGIFGAILGSIIATLGLITPSVIIILLIAIFLKNFKDNPYVKNAFYGLRPASAGLITAAGLTIIVANLFPKGLNNLTFDDIFNFDIFIHHNDTSTTIISNSNMFSENFNWVGLALGIVLWILTNKVEKTKKLHPIILIGISAIVGLVFSM